MIQTQENGKKASFWDWFWPIGPKFGQPNFFFFFSKIWLRKSLDIMVSYHHVEYQKKTNDPLQKMNLAMDGKTDGRADGRTRVIS